MTKRIHANGQTQLHARYQITGGCDTDKNIIVAAIYHANTGHLEAQEFHQHREDTLRAAAWFRSQQVELVIIGSTANYHLLYYDTLRQEGINIAVINPIVVKYLLRVEGKSDKLEGPSHTDYQSSQQHPHRLWFHSLSAGPDQ